jgi:hypothetical protein
MLCMAHKYFLRLNLKLGKFLHSGFFDTDGDVADVPEITSTIRIILKNFNAINFTT